MNSNDTCKACGNANILSNLVYQSIGKGFGHNIRYGGAWSLGRDRNPA